MSEITKHILEAASDLLDGFGYPISHLDIPDLIPVVAHALMERDKAATERAAKIADSWRDTAKKLVGKELDEERRLYHGIAADMARDIAAAIRSQP